MAEFDSDTFEEEKYHEHFKKLQCAPKNAFGSIRR
jgi:hypothetical protein